MRSSVRAAGQRHVQRLGLELRLQLGVGQRLAARGQRGLDALLDDVDLGAARLLLLDRQRRHALEQFGDATGLAEESGLRVLQLGRRAGGGEFGFGGLHQEVEVVHVGRSIEPASSLGNGDGKKEKAGTQGVGLVVRRPKVPVGFDRRQPAEPAAA